MRKIPYREGMDFLTGFYHNNRTVILVLAALIMLTALFRLVKKILDEKRRRRELEQATADKIRDENLNNVILNQNMGSRRPKEVHIPYDVDYGSPKRENHITAGAQDSGDEGGNTMVRLVERTELSVRKFLLNPSKVIRIGSDIQKNDIVVLAEDVAPRQCEIFSAKNKVYIRNLAPGNGTVVKRKKEKAIVDERGIRLLSDDTVILGRVSYDITIVD